MKFEPHIKKATKEVCRQLAVGSLIKYLDIYSVAIEDTLKTQYDLSALPKDCVGMVVDVFAAPTMIAGEEEVFWNYEIYRTEGFREVITSEDIAWLLKENHFEILWSPEEKNE